MTKLLLALLLAADIAAQTSATATPLTAESIFEPKNLVGERADRAVRFVRDIMAGKTQIIWEPVLRVAVIKGQKEWVEQTMQLLQKYDVPEPKRPDHRTQLLEYTVYLIGAFTNTGNSRGTAIPPEIDVAIKELKGAVGFKEFRLLDAIPISSRNTGGPTEISGLLPTQAVGTNERYFYKLGMGSPFVLEDGKTVTTNNFNFHIALPGRTQEKAGEVGIRTDLLIKEGQKIVIGKIRLDGGQDAVFLIVTVKVL